MGIRQGWTREIRTKATSLKPAEAEKEQERGAVGAKGAAFAWIRERKAS